MRPLVLALMTMLLAGAALAQGGPYADTTSCGQFITMENTVQMELLSQIAPFGDDMDAEDRGAAQDWVDEVSKACAGHPDLALTEAARQAMAEPK